MLFNRNETLVPYRNLFCGNKKIIIVNLSRVSEPEPPGARVFGWSQSSHFGPAPAPHYIFIK